MVDAFFFLPPKEAQGKVRQNQGRAAVNNFAFSRTPPPLDHLSVNITIQVHLSTTLYI